MNEVKITIEGPARSGKSVLVKEMFGYTSKLSAKLDYLVSTVDNEGLSTSYGLDRSKRFPEEYKYHTHFIVDVKTTEE